MTKPKHGYTLVRHSAFTGRGDHQFRNGVELSAIPTKRSLGLIKARGGLVFDTYDEASKAEYTYNYPEGHEGIIPGARGSFVSIQMGQIFVPEQKPIES